MADDDDLVLRVELGGAVLQLFHRDVRGVVDPGERGLPAVANVEEHDGLVRVEAPLELGRLDVLGHRVSLLGIESRPPYHYSAGRRIEVSGDTSTLTRSPGLNPRPGERGGEHLDAHERAGNGNVVARAAALEDIALHGACDAARHQRRLVDAEGLRPEAEQTARAHAPRAAAVAHRHARAPVGLHEHAHLAQLEHADRHEVGAAHDLRDEAGARPPVDLLRPALLGETAARQHGDAGGQRQGFGGRRGSRGGS